MCRQSSSEEPASARYFVATCFDPSCDNELYLTETVSGIGEFSGDYDLKIDWDDTAKAFAFLVNGPEVGRISMADYNSDSRVVEVGGYTFDPSHYTGTRIYSEVRDIAVNESGYIAVYIDEVKVDGEVYDDFAGGLIDDSKWSYRSEER